MERLAASDVRFYWVLLRAVALILLIWAISISAFAGEDINLSGPNQATANPKELKVATGEWVPYVSESYRHHGAIGLLITKIFAAHEISVRFGYFPWPRGYQMVLDGHWDATMPYYCSPEREQLYYCSDPIMDGKQVFFHRKDFAFDWETLEDLDGFNVGATLGYYYGEKFEQFEKSGRIKVHRIARDESNFMVLLRERIQVFPQDLEVGYSMIRRLFPPEEQKMLTHHPKPLHTQPLHLIFPRSNPLSKERLDIFNAGLKRLRESGELQVILRGMREGVYIKD